VKYTCSHSHTNTHTHTHIHTALLFLPLMAKSWKGYANSMALPQLFLALKTQTCLHLGIHVYTPTVYVCMVVCVCGVCAHVCVCGVRARVCVPVFACMCLTLGQRAVTVVPAQEHKPAQEKPHVTAYPLMI